MLDNLRRRMGLLYPIVSALGVALLVMTLSRAGLALWQWDRVSAADGWGTLFVGGLRVDLSTLCYLLMLPALLTVLMAGEGPLGRNVLKLLRLFLVVALWFVVFMELATPSFILEYDLRPNRLFYEYLGYPHEVFAMLWSGYKTELFIGLLVSNLTLWLAWHASGRWTRQLAVPKWYWRPLLALLVVVIGVGGARSSLGHRPLNPALVAYSTDPLMNDLVLNSAYAVAFALKQSGSEDSAFQYYPNMTRQEIVQRVREATNLGASDFVSKAFPTLAEHPASYAGKPKNLVILLQESLGARYVGALGGLPLTPNLDTLIAQGWSFNRLYATGTRSVRGIEAVTTGFSPTPTRAVVKLSDSQRNFFSIADLLRSHGYHTQFIYGGESHFDNMKSFFLGNGFVDMQDRPTFGSLAFEGAWGASDEDLYVKAHRQFSQLHRQGQPFFSLVFTSSNHSPFDYPKGRIEPYNQPDQTRENAAKYSDWALGQFMAKARASDYWKDTLFLVVADHDSRTYGDKLVPINHFRIPAVIVGEGIAPRQDDRLASQMDLAPTLMSLIGISDQHPMIGHDLTREVPREKLRAMMQFYKNFAWMNDDNQVVIYQPEQAAQGFRYDPQTDRLSPAPVSEELARTALANALWGSLAYGEGLYPGVDRRLREAGQAVSAGLGLAAGAP
ncbi:LTA synthase family protein [Ferrimonas sediminicola]|uniref:LTA synthase family protein n=1 Tax=Ferrimonas sediminicola TaxID=2569538 RepID=A0A4U1BBS0_9GAMM|nr:LTA synthase family protein [Ferrimonas sediminicola]TKB48391.1 LTA synthase family protein [Ferrimonas sediminicola]